MMAGPSRGAGITAKERGAWCGVVLLLLAALVWQQSGPGLCTSLATHSTLTSGVSSVIGSSARSSSSSSSGPRFAYAFYMSDAPYLCSALVNAQRITRMGKSPHFDIVFMVPPGFGIPPKMQQSIDELGVIVKVVQPLSLGGFDQQELRQQQSYYQHCMMKLQAFNLTSYDRVLFMDSDQIVLRSMEHLFTQIPSSTVAAPRSYWLNPGTFPQGYRSEGWRKHDGPEVGPQQKFGSYWMLIEPSERLWSRLYDKYYPDGKPNFKDVFDMDLLNIEFKDDVTLLPGNLVIGSFDLLSQTDSRPKVLKDFVTDIDKWYSNAYVMHFYSPGKVWSTPPERFNASYSHARPELKRVWTEWWESAAQVCDAL